MNARELMDDSPELGTLLSRCIHEKYCIDEFDFFYMQAISERDKLTYPEFNPADGHWYGAAVCVAGGYIHRELKIRGVDQELLDLNKKFIRASIQIEIAKVKTDKDIDEWLNLSQRISAKQPNLIEMIFPVLELWSENYSGFISAYKKNDGQVYEKVDFSSPTFSITRLFLPFKEKRPPRETEIMRLESNSLHDVRPFLRLNYGWFSPK